MEWFIAVGVIVLMAFVIVGLFHGPSSDHRPRRAAARTRRRAEPEARPGADGSPGPSPDPSLAAPLVAPLITPEPLLSSAAGAPTNPAVDPPAYTLPPARPRRHHVRRPAGRPGGRRS